MDLQDELIKIDRDPEKVNKMIIKLTDLGNEFVENRMDKLLKSKDVLTMPQREQWIHQMIFTSG